jgi:hypothetical protein
MVSVCEVAVVGFVRFQAVEPNGRGTFPGVFALVNWLDLDGLLTPEERQWRLLSNAWFHADLVDPATVDPTVFDRTLHPKVGCWFDDSAVHLLDRVPPYLAVLDAHGVAWQKVTSTNPGRVIYRDEHQIVVAIE